MDSKFIVLALLGVLGFAGYQYSHRTRRAPAVEFRDVVGKTHSLTNGTPKLVAFWITNCGYSTRVLTVLEKIRAQIPEDKLEIVAFYVNPGSNQNVAAMEEVKQYHFSLAAAQQSPALIQQLQESFQIRGAGVDIYLVDALGKIHAVDAENVKTSALVMNLRKTVKKEARDLAWE